MYVLRVWVKIKHDGESKHLNRLNQSRIHCIEGELTIGVIMPEYSFTHSSVMSDS